MTKNDLKNYRALVREARQLRSLLAELEAAKYSVPGGDFSGAPREASAPGSAIERRVIRYQDAIELYREKIAETTALVIAIEEALSSLDSPLERLVLRLRYIEGRGWSNVCAELASLGHCERQVYYIHGAALKKIKEFKI